MIINPHLLAYQLGNIIGYLSPVITAVLIWYGIKLIRIIYNGIR